MGESVGEHTFARQLTALRAEPNDAAEQVTQALPGEPLLVLEERDGWARVETHYSYPGWVRLEQLGGAFDEASMERTVAAPLDHARSLLGAPYEWGGMTAAGIDCSGLVHISFRRAGWIVPRDADQQEEAAERLDESELRPGDLVTYGSEDRADHIAFWLGAGRILHATGRDAVKSVVEEPEPAELRARRRALVRLAALDRR